MRLADDILHKPPLLPRAVTTSVELERVILARESSEADTFRPSIRSIG
jgi:hypothetical protein